MKHSQKRRKGNERGILSLSGDLRGYYGGIIWMTNLILEGTNTIATGIRKSERKRERE